MALPIDERAPSVGGDVALGGGPAGVGFSHVEDLLNAVTPDSLLHLSALTRPRAQDEGRQRRSGHLDVAAQHVMHDSTAPNNSPRNSEAPFGDLRLCGEAGFRRHEDDDF